MGIIKDIVRDSADACEAGGFRWRIKKVSSVDLARAGLARLQMLLPISDQKQEVDRIKQLPEEEQDEALQKLAVKSAAQLDERRLVVFHEHKQAVVAAGVTHVATLDAPDKWEACRVTLKEQEQDETKSIVFVANMPGDSLNALFDAIMELSGLTQENGEALATFRSEQRASDADGLDSQEVRKAAT